MKKIGLETYTHNFTLNYPFGGGKQFTGKNVYGILRASRIGSTEAMVFSIPYRPPNTAHFQITHGVPLLLAFADFARSELRSKEFIDFSFLKFLKCFRAKVLVKRHNFPGN